MMVFYGCFVVILGKMSCLERMMRCASDEA